MKKTVILLPLLALTLTGCADMGFGSRSAGERSKTEKSSIPVEEIALKILHSVTFFPELNDDLNLSEYVELDPGFGYTLADYTFTSTNNQVIRIENYHATCIGEGYAEVSITGPKVPNGAALSFYVGSIAGTYAPLEPSLSSKVSLVLGEADEATKECDVNFTILEGAKYNKEEIEAYSGTATYVKDRTPFLNLTFDDGHGPSSFVPITAFLSTFGIEPEEFEIETNIYGLMSYDEDYGLEIRMMLNDFPVVFYANN